MNGVRPVVVDIVFKLAACEDDVLQGPAHYGSLRRMRPCGPIAQSGRPVRRRRQASWARLPSRHPARMRR